MENILRILALVGKVSGVAVALDPSAFGASPQVGVLIFLIASILKDTVNRVGDYLDNKKMDNSFGQ